MLGGFPPCKAIVSPQLEFLLVLSIQISVTWVHWKTATVICGNLSLTLITPAVVPKKHILFELIFWNNCAWLNMCREHFEGRWVWLSLISIKMEHPPPYKCAPLLVSYMMHTGTGVIRVKTKNDDDRKSSLYIREKRYTRSYFCDKVLYYRRANSEMSFYMENYLNLSSYMESYFCNEVLHGELLQKWGSNKELLQ